MARHLIWAMVLGLVVLGGSPSRSADGDTRDSLDSKAPKGTTTAAADERATADRIVAQALAAIEPIHVVRIDTRAVAQAVRAGRSVQLPFVDLENRLTVATLRLTLHSLRAPGLTVADLKDG